ncbi:MAG: chitobiase/beta-hexosaminidase C-terminal domain-containing protein [Bacteroidales bacterium]|nr:chitobiase/beta-hexosaminidase C-terminal domain-containing protein [Bacteroidales bacterium]
MAPAISGETPFHSIAQVTITGPDGAQIRYTVDGSSPTEYGILYTGPFSISRTVTVLAVSIKNGIYSEVTSKLFTRGNGDNDAEGYNFG